MTALGILKIVLGFTLVIGLHEFGHALAAYYCGVKIKRFSIGMGPGLLFKNVPIVNELVISPIVIGGYVEMDEKTLEQKSFWQNFFVSVSGMLMNVFLGIVLLVINGTGIIKAILFSFKVWLFGMPMFFTMLYQKAISFSESVAGPIGIGKLLASDAYPYPFILALVSLSIAAMNLLPLPPLDGGRIFVSVVGKLIGEKAAKKVNVALTAIGVFLLLSLLFFSTYNDIAKIIHAPK